MTNKEIMAVVQAAECGERLETRFKHDRKATWVPCTSPVWDFNSYDYRVKPKPLVLWVNTYANTEPAVHVSYRDAVRSAQPNALRVAVRMVEQPE